MGLRGVLCLRKSVFLFVSDWLGLVWRGRGAWQKSVGIEHKKNPRRSGGVFSRRVQKMGTSSSSSSWTGSGGRITGRSGAARTTTLMPRSLAIRVASALPSASVLQW